MAHAWLLLQQEAARACLHKQLRVVDADSLAECHRLATSAQLGQDILGQVQELQAAAQLLQAAVDAVQAHRQQQQQQQQDATTTGVPAGAQAELAASLRKIEELCKPGEEGQPFPASTRARAPCACVVKGPGPLNPPCSMVLLCVCMQGLSLHSCVVGATLQASLLASCTCRHAASHEG